MKFAAFAVADYEMATFKKFIKETGYDMDIYMMELDEASTDLSKYDAISLISLKKIENSVIDKLTNCKLICLRSIGFQYIDTKYCKEKGITVTNACYEPYNVADFTIMQILMLLRKAKVSVCRALVNDFSLSDMEGRELRSMKVGVLGTGKIGSQVIRNLSGFGCKIYCFSHHENEDIKQYAEYKDLDFILRTCDIITLHMPLNEESSHIINKEAISKMKDGVILINTARGGIIETDALIEGIENEKIGACALDTVEGEEGVAHVAVGTKVEGLSKKKDIMYLKQFANVLITQHYAFFTEEAVYSMIECSFKAIASYISGMEIPYKVNE